MWAAASTRLRASSRVGVASVAATAAGPRRTQPSMHLSDLIRSVRASALAKSRSFVISPHLLAVQHSIASLTNSQVRAVTSVVRGLQTNHLSVAQIRRSLRRFNSGGDGRHHVSYYQQLISRLQETRAALFARTPPGFGNFKRSNRDDGDDEVESSGKDKGRRSHDAKEEDAGDEDAAVERERARRRAAKRREQRERDEEVDDDDADAESARSSRKGRSRSSRDDEEPDERKSTNGSSTGLTSTMFWGGVAVAVLLSLLLTQGGDLNLGANMISFQDFKRDYLSKGLVQEVVVINREMVRVKLRPEAVRDPTWVRPGLGALSAACLLLGSLLYARPWELPVT